MAGSRASVSALSKRAGAANILLQLSPCDCLRI